jgi:hypothetical protein
MHAPPTPDVEKICYDALKDLGGISVYAFDSQMEWPFVQDRVSIQIDVHASSKKRARDRAYSSREILLRLAMDPTSPVGRVEVLSGPLWVPEEDGAPRYVVRVGVSVRAARNVK